MSDEGEKKHKERVSGPKSAYIALSLHGRLPSSDCARRPVPCALLACFQIKPFAQVASPFLSLLFIYGMTAASMKVRLHRFVFVFAPSLVCVGGAPGGWTRCADMMPELGHTSIPCSVTVLPIAQNTGTCIFIDAVMMGYRFSSSHRFPEGENGMKGGVSRSDRRTTSVGLCSSNMARNLQMEGRKVVSPGVAVFRRSAKIPVALASTRSNKSGNSSRKACTIA